MRLRILSMIFVAIIGIASKAQTIVESGDGWSLDSEGLLMVTEDMSYSSSSKYPWYASIESVKSVVFGEGVTSIGSYALYGCSGLTSVTIPEGVTSIGSYAFSGCSDLTSVTIPEGVTSIGSYAFYKCSGLTNVTIPSSVTSIGSCAFGYCPSIKELHIGSVESWCKISMGSDESNPLTTITSAKEDIVLYVGDRELTELVIPEGVTSIGNWAFNGCSGLTSVTIPGSVESIGKCAFMGCSGLISVTIPKGVNNIGDSAFSGCSGLTNVTIQEGVNSIGNSVFLGCSRLTNMTIPEGITSIGNSTFNSCSGLTSVTIPESVTTIGHYAFSRCSALTNVTIPERVTSIGDGVFQYCSGLMSMTIPEKVTSISKSMFEGCSSLTSVTIPESVTSFDEYAFRDCSSLTSITIPERVTNIGIFAFMGCKSIAELHVSSVESWFNISFGNSNSSPLCSTTGEVKLYVGAEEVTEVVIPDGVTAINDYAFRNCSGLTSVTIPEGVESIGYYVFYGCSGLTSMAIPESVTSIGGAAFQGCSGLISVTIPDGVESIGNSAFYGCSGLTSVTIPESVTTLGIGAFSGCKNINELHLGSVESYCKISFGANSSPLYSTTGEVKLYVGDDEVTSIVIPDGVTAINNFAFKNCSGLTNVTIPEGVESIGPDAFSRCSGLVRVTIPESVISIGNHAFYGCSGLTSLTIPEGVESIDNYAFSGCSGLTSVTIEEGVETIGNNAFYNCSGLTCITIPESVTKIDYSAFQTCKSLVCVDIKSTGKVTYTANSSDVRNTFYNCTNLKYVFLHQTEELVDIVSVFTTAVCKKIEMFFVPDELLEDYRQEYKDNEDLASKFTGFSYIEHQTVDGDEETVALSLEKGSYDFITWAVNSGEQVREGEEISIALTEDFDMAADNVSWQTLGTAEHPFKGIFEGNGYTVTLGGEELEGNVDNALFGKVSDEAVIENVNVRNVYADYAEASDMKSDDGKKTYYALLARENYGLIRNCIVKGSVADMNDETAVACLVTDNYGTIDHCVVYFVGIEDEDEEENSNKRKIIVMQNVGVGRTAGVIVKTASNGKKKATSKAVTLSSAPKFSTDDINSDYRIYSDEEMATGEPAFWMNMEGQGYTGAYTGKWSMSSDGLFPVLADASHKKVVKVDYEVEGLSASAIADLSLDGTSFAKVGAVATVSYDQQPSVIDGVLATMEDASAQFIVPEPDDNGIVTVTLKYASLATGLDDKPLGMSDVKTGVSVSGHTVSIANAEGVKVSVTDMMGRVVYTNPSASDAISLSLPSAGIYVVKAGDMNQKIVVR